MNEELNTNMEPIEEVKPEPIEENVEMTEDTPINMDIEEEPSDDTDDGEEGEPEKIIIEDAEGKTMECDVLLEFTSDVTNKHYIIYTANKEDENGNVAIYSSIVDESGEVPTLKALEDEQDNQIIKDIIDELKEQIDKQ